MPLPILRRLVCLFLAVTAVGAAAAAENDWRFDSIDGGQITLSQWQGQPILVVNTASRCGFTDQYDGLQALYDRYRDAGLVVLAVPSQDFKQELATNEKVKEFCELNFDLDMPMTTITPVRGEGAHDFYKWVAASTGFAPAWNFNKILLGPRGEVVATYGSMVRPQAPRLTREIEALLAAG